MPGPVLFLAAADKPNQVWAIGIKQWLPVTDARFLGWKQLTEQEPPSYATAAELSAAIGVADQAPTTTKAQVDAFADARLAEGYTDTVTNRIYQCDPDSIGKWTALAANAGLALVMGVNPLPTFSIITADNRVIILTANDAFALFAQRVMPWVSATVLYARTLKDQIIAGSPPADITVGWP